MDENSKDSGKHEDKPVLNISSEEEFLTLLEDIDRELSYQMKESKFLCVLLQWGCESVSVTHHTECLPTTPLP